ncbi:hypothetical protein F9U42_05840 [Pectobacterium versatile]|nr:hypothetical protein EIP93_13340 [Pectobacterium versatile]MCL6333782.1 hypothetical protein [Pectobacterium carotovorum subsp. carotovorum]ULS48231.1 hypothetical protein F9W95_16780 [Pectobacterium carotovorum]MBQ4766653.1 hypothetical protein [Pectobacterium versatile]MBQ4780227.1 hypothetical protein [Pectobacterium versatile]
MTQKCDTDRQKNMPITRVFLIYCRPLQESTACRRSPSYRIYTVGFLGSCATKLGKNTKSLSFLRKHDKIFNFIPFTTLFLVA